MFFFFRKNPRRRRTDAMRPPSHPHGLGRAPGAMANAAVATPGKQRGTRGRKGSFAKSDGRPAKSQALGRSPAWGRPRIPFLVSRGAPCAIARGAPHIFFPRRLSRGKGLQRGAREGRVRRMTALRPPCVFFFIRIERQGRTRAEPSHAYGAQRGRSRRGPRGSRRDSPRCGPKANHMRSNQGAQRPPGPGVPTACAFRLVACAPGCGAARDTDVRDTCIRAGASQGVDG